MTKICDVRLKRRVFIFFALFHFTLFFNFNTAFSSQLIPDFDSEEDFSMVTNGRHIMPNEFENMYYGKVVNFDPGVYIGVGSFRTFNAALHANFSHLILMDANEDMVKFNRRNLSIIRKSATVEEYITNLTGMNKNLRAKYKKFAKKNYQSKSSIEDIYESVIEERYPELSKHACRAIQDIAESYIDGDFHHFFFSNEINYNKIRKLALEDRVSVIRGDWSGSDAITRIANALNHNGMRISAVDVSNIPTAPAYLQSSPTDRSGNTDFIYNLKSLPRTSNSYILFTQEKNTKSWVYVATHLNKFIEESDHNSNEGLYFGVQKAIHSSVFSDMNPMGTVLFETGNCNLNLL